MDKFNYGTAEAARARALWDIVGLRVDTHDVVMLQGPDLALLMVDLMVQAEALAKLVASRQAVKPTIENPLGWISAVLTNAASFEGTTLGAKADIERAQAAQCGPHYKAALEAVRLLWRDSKRVRPPLVAGGQGYGTGLIALPGVPGGGSTPLLDGPNTTTAGQLPAPKAQFVPVATIVLGLAGIVTAGVTTYFVTDRICQVYDPAALAAVALRARFEELQLRVAKGMPLPPPPGPIETGAIVDKLAKNYESSKWWGIGAGVMGLIIGGAGVYGAMTRPRSSGYVGSSAPSSAPRLQASNPRRRRAARKAAAPVRRKKQRNPLKHGYSRDTVSRNIGAMVKAGRKPSVAAAAALGQARQDWRRKHPTGGFPRHLETPAERAAHARRRANASKKRKAKPKPAPRRKAQARPRPKAQRRRSARPKTRRKGTRRGKRR